MASHYYFGTIPNSSATGNVTKATATGGTNIELRVDDGIAGNSKHDVLKFLKELENFITSDNAPA